MQGQMDLGMRIIVENSDTGERFIQASSGEWTDMLLAWKRDLDGSNRRLAPIQRRAIERGTWRLYGAAKRALYRRSLPCPMPWDHVMFEAGSTYLRVR